MSEGRERAETGTRGFSFFDMLIFVGIGNANGACGGRRIAGSGGGLPGGHAAAAEPVWRLCDSGTARSRQTFRRSVVRAGRHG